MPFRAATVMLDYDFVRVCQRLLIPALVLLPVKDAVVQFLAG